MYHSINSNVEVLKREYATAQVKEIARNRYLYNHLFKNAKRSQSNNQCALVKAKINNTKLNVYKKVLQEVCEKFNVAEEFIRERIEELCTNGKLSVEEVNYLFMNDYDNF